MNQKDIKEDSFTTSFSEITQKMTQLEARFVGPLNPLGKEGNKHIHPVHENPTSDGKSSMTPERVKNLRPEEVSTGKSEEFSIVLPSKRRKDASPLLPARTPRSDNAKTPENSIFSAKLEEKDYSLQSTMSINVQIQLLQQEMQRLESANTEKALLLRVSESTISHLSEELEKKNETITSFQQEIEALQDLAKRGKKALIKVLRSLQEKNRQELKARLFNDSFRLGRVTMVRTGTKFQEYWEDGQDIIQTKSQLELITKQKENLEKQKKKLKRNNDEELSSTLPLRLALLAREEIEMKEKLDKLEIEKNIHIQDCRRTAEEDSAKYSKGSADYEAWPVLHGRYLLLSLLGKGGYSEVYRAYDLFEHIDLAIKFHQLSATWAEAIKANYIKHALRENKIHRELNHPRIVKHFDTLEVDNNCFCTILEYCPGEDLSMYMKKHKILTEKEAKSIMQQIFAGLKYLNDQPEKIIHYDLKPHNILLNNGEVKITDFGLSKVMDPSKPSLELTSQGVGTYWYQAPECFETGTTAKINSKVDVWSAGVVFYELIYSQKPFGNNVTQEKILKDQVIVKATSVSFPAKPSVTNECKEFIRKCLEYNVDDRWDIADAYNSPYLQGKK